MYKSTALYYYAYDILLWHLAYKQLVQAENWEKGVNEKTFFAKSPYNPLVGLENNS